MNDSISTSSWKDEFRRVYARGIAAWKAGRRTPASLFDTADRVFLSSIGCTDQELFDFIEDFLDWGEPDLETALAIQAIRRDYFLEVLRGQPAQRVAPMHELPSKAAAIDGISWLPRLIVKARLKLRGEMPPELMYGCGGDRPFLRRMNMTLPQFLELVRDSGEDDRKIVDAVKQSARLA
jgi:hypothetical protein